MAHVFDGWAEDSIDEEHDYSNNAGYGGYGIGELFFGERAEWLEVD